MAEETNEVITLFDEDGKEVRFEHLDTFELNDKIYIVLLEVLESGEENDEVVIFRLEKDGEDDTLYIIEDEDELQAAFEEFQFRVEDTIDFND